MNALVHAWGQLAFESSECRKRLQRACGEIGSQWTLQVSGSRAQGLFLRVQVSGKTIVLFRCPPRFFLVARRFHIDGWMCARMEYTVYETVYFALQRN